MSRESNFDDNSSYPVTLLMMESDHCSCACRFLGETNLKKPGGEILSNHPLNKIGLVTSAIPNRQNAYFYHKERLDTYFPFHFSLLRSSLSDVLVSCPSGRQ